MPTARLREVVTPIRENYVRTVAYLRSQGLTDDHKRLSDYGIELADFVFEQDLVNREQEVLSGVFADIGDSTPDQDVLTCVVAERLLSVLPMGDIFAYGFFGSKYRLDRKHIITLGAISIIERGLENKLLIPDEDLIHYNA